MSQDLKNKFNVLSKCVDLQSKIGQSLAVKLTQSQFEGLQKIMMEDGGDFAEASEVMRACGEVFEEGPDALGYEKSIEVLTKLITMGDKNIGIVAKMLGEDVCKVALQNNIKKESLDDVSKIVKVPNTKKLCSL